MTPPNLGASRVGVGMGGGEIGGKGELHKGLVANPLKIKVRRYLEVLTV